MSWKANLSKASSSNVHICRHQRSQGAHKTHVPRRAWSHVPQPHEELVEIDLSGTVLICQPSTCVREPARHPKWQATLRACHAPIRLKSCVPNCVFSTDKYEKNSSKSTMPLPSVSISMNFACSLVASSALTADSIDRQLGLFCVAVPPHLAPVSKAPSHT